MSSELKSFRATTVQRLTDILTAHCPDEPCERVDLVCRDMEIGIFNRAIDHCERKNIARDWSNSRFLSVYVSICKTVYANIDPDAYVGNKALLKRLMTENEFRPHEIAALSVEAMFPEHWNHITRKNEERDQYEINAKPVAMTDQFKCERCKSRECSYMELQTRSCDEPASIFVTCHGCGNKWRIG
jgi:DNA-directed RNA polymerase subunit M/transcription elongation factor TFIIS